MKKLCMILAFLLVVPGMAFGMEMMNDAAMDDVTGQAGVSIAFDDVQIFMNIERIAWIDNDGFSEAGGTTGAGGAVGLNNFQLDTLQVNAITGSDGTNRLESIGQFDVNYDYGDADPLEGGTLAAQTTDQTKGLDNWTPADNGAFRALTIDATSQLPALSAGKTANYGGAQDFNIGGVMIGIPTMEIYIPTMSLTPVFFDEASADDAGNGANNAYNAAAATGGGATYGTVLLENITFTTLSGWIEIAPH